MRPVDAILTPALHRRRRLAAGALLISAPVNAVGVAALIAMYVGFAIGERSTAMTLGRTNDILGLALVDHESTAGLSERPATLAERLPAGR